MKTVLITGGATGIGKECAKLFAANGYDVIITYNKSKEKADRLCRHANDASLMISAYQCDIKDASQIAHVVDTIIEEHGKIDVLINNSGMAQQKLFTDISEEEWDEMFDINTKGVFLMTKAVIKNMISRHVGKIINISSMWGQVGASCEVHYSASKAAVIGMTKALAKEVGPSSINVNCICPGVIDTAMMSCFDDAVKKELADETPLCRLGQPHDVAKAALFLAGDGAQFITGQVIGVNGGFII